MKKHRPVNKVPKIISGMYLFPDHMCIQDIIHNSSEYKLISRYERNIGEFLRPLIPGHDLLLGLHHGRCGLVERNSWHGHGMMWVPPGLAAAPCSFRYRSTRARMFTVVWVARY